MIHILLCLFTVAIYIIFIYMYGTYIMINHNHITNVRNIVYSRKYGAYVIICKPNSLISYTLSSIEIVNNKKVYIPHLFATITEANLYIHNKHNKNE